MSRTNRCWSFACACVLLVGCASDEQPAVDTATIEPDVAVDLGADIASPYCPTPGHAPPIGRLCIVGETFADAGISDAEPDEDAGTTKPAYRLVAGEPVRFQIYPKGCFSDRCSRVDEAVCSVASSEGAKLALEAAFCLKPRSGKTCGDDCNGGGVALCSSEALAAGAYTVTVASLSLSFTIPSEVPNEGLCEGE